MLLNDKPRDSIALFIDIFIDFHELKFLRKINYRTGILKTHQTYFR